jgi:hypothetical protein
VLSLDKVEHALPASFVFMIVTMAGVGLAGAMNGFPLLLTTSLVVALVLVLFARAQLRSPVLNPPASSALLPETARAPLATALAQLDDERARTLLLDIARTGEATFASLPDAFRTAALGESVIDLLCEAGPLALEAAHLRAIATEVGVRADTRHAAEAQQIDDAANARFALLEDVLALLGRIARDGARSDEEVVRLLQLVREEATRRVEAENIVSALLQTPPTP